MLFYEKANRPFIVVRCSFYRVIPTMNEYEDIPDFIVRNFTSQVRHLVRVKRRSILIELYWIKEVCLIAGQRR